ncbi:Zinc finger CCHC-type [Arabidopsis thaliana x Arabidopsis arenosa]|uniref:Zinc finger CCHC-type n=1 Tax=Arabidopsis thaliana x Arabidopsis arenosa TaxID=1240361 RepID=A0A8T2AWL4_9BRAS|nr:Zinc finger CCHC-type [Arabidopsis thaliana x Arabidopsis arenosa]
MEPPREGSSVTRPPFLDGNNYSYWKIRMKSFISSIDGEAWNSIILGYNVPVITDNDGNTTPKPVEQWTVEENRKAMCNSKALNAIYNAIDVGKFRMISSYKTAKEVWEALETTYEGTSKVKQTKLIMLKSRFDSLLMQHDSTIADFYKELRDIANESYSLGKEYSEFDMVMKVLTSLPDKFSPKKTAMTESNDVTKMKLEELIGSLQTYEMEMRMQDQNRGLAERAKSLAFLSTERKSDDENENEVMLTKKIGRYMKKLELLKDNKLSKSSNNYGGRDDRSKEKRQVQCHECHGFGHIKAECANLQKRKEKSLKTTLSDSETESDEENVSYSNVISFVAEIEESVKVEPVKTESTKTGTAETDEDYSDDEDLPPYEDLLQNWVDICSQNVMLMKEKKELVIQVGYIQKQLEEKEEKLKQVNHELEETKKGVKMLNNGTSKLDHILTMGRVGHQPQGLGYKGNDSSSKTVFVSGGRLEGTSKTHKNQQEFSKPFRPICHHCGEIGHIRPRCFRNCDSQAQKESACNLSVKTELRKTE